MTVVVPKETRAAAKRAFLRTTAQGYEAMLAVGISANVIVGLVRGEVDVLVLTVTTVVAVITPPLAGLRSYLSIISEGIPDEYAEAVEPRHGA